ncbi:hypothetical protein DN069_36570 [Streptacidiphilus pinicola]|uniref:Gram-positive cocci surface proteins LPxTG domain-containing protein n=1 Tax=Streptacidiphilus pinicola TaxID=2219663 RepID=A0A2X0K072_9ACTN|nr:hypothetical protein [Streptacidiphilus pinicola]RAG80720.1 hypothetical protein DN069_36570 [Streptacidiphilus pinicola]
MKLRRSWVTAVAAVAFSPIALVAAPTASAALSVTPPQALTPPGSPWQTTIPLPAALVDAGGVVSDQDDHTDLRLDLSGLAPGITAGSGWRRFTLTGTLPATGPNSDLSRSPHEIQWTLALADDRGGRDVLARYAHVQYLDGSTWTALPAWAGSRTEPAVTRFDVAGNQQEVTVRIPVRVSVDAGAPTGPAYAVAVGSYVDVVQGSFAHTSFGSQQVSVAAGAATRPSASPASGHASARTAAFSPLPLIAGIAGAAAVVGGGVAFALRRRGRA